MGRNKGKNRQVKKKEREQQLQRQINQLKKKQEAEQIKKQQKKNKQKVKEKNNAFEEKRNEIIEELQKQKEYFKGALESLKYVNANKFKPKEELKQHTDKVKKSIEKFGYSPSSNDIKNNHRRYKYMLTEHIQKLEREQKKDKPKLKMKSLNDKYYEKDSPKAAKKFERAQQVATQINKEKRKADMKKNTNKFLAAHGEDIVNLVRNNVNDKGVDWGNLITGAGMMIPNPVVQVASAVGNVGWNAYKGWKNKKKEEQLEKLSADQRRKAIAYEKYKAKKKMKRQSNQEVINNREMMLYTTRQMNRKHRHFKLPVPDLQWWDNMREFEKQIQIQQVNKAKGIWDSQYQTRLETHAAKQDIREAKKEERNKRTSHPLTETQYQLNQIRRISPSLATIVEDHLRKAPSAQYQLTGPELAKKIVSDKERIFRSRAKDLYKYEKHSKDIRENPENYWVELPEREELPAYYDARIMSPNISAIELKGMVKKNNSLYNNMTKILQTVASATGTLSKFALPALFRLYAPKLDPETGQEIIKALSTALGQNSPIVSALEETFKNKKEVEDRYMKRLEEEKANYADKHTNFATEFIKKFDIVRSNDQSQAFTIQKALTEEYNFTKNPLVNLRDNENLQEIVLSNINKKYRLNGNKVNEVPLAFYNVNKFINNPAVSKENLDNFTTKLALVEEDIKTKKIHNPNYNYNFTTDSYELKEAFRKVVDDITKDGEMMAKFDKKVNDDTKLRKAFAGAFLGNPFLEVNFDKNHPLYMLYEAYKNPNSEDLKVLNELGMNPVEMKRRGKAISEYAIFNNLNARDKLSLMESTFTLTPEEFKATIDDAVTKHKIQNGINQATNIWEDVSGAFRDGFNLLNHFRHEKAERTLEEQAKDLEDYQQSLSNFNEFIIDAVDGSINDAIFNKEKWYEDDNNIIRDKNRNMAIKAFGSQVLSIGIPSIQIFQDWFRDKMNHFHTGDIHPFSINNNRSPEEVRRYANNLAAEWYDFMKYTRLPVNTHFFNRGSNSLALQTPSGYSPEQEAMLELKVHKTRPAFELREQSKEKLKNSKRIRDDRNTRPEIRADEVKNVKKYKQEVEDYAVEGYQEREFIINLTKQNKNFYHLVNIMNDNELKMMDMQKAEEAYKAVEHMPIDRINYFMNNKVRQKLNKNYDPNTGTYNTTLDFSGAEEYQVADNSSLNRTELTFTTPRRVMIQESTEARDARTAIINRVAQESPIQMPTGSPSSSPRKRPMPLFLPRGEDNVTIDSITDDDNTE